MPTDCELLNELDASREKFFIDRRTKVNGVITLHAPQGEIEKLFVKQLVTLTKLDCKCQFVEQILAGIAAAGGVLGTIFGLFNQLEMHSIQNHVSNLEASTNMLIHVQHKNQQQFKIITAEMAHLTTIIETLIQYNPALVYAKLMSQVDDIADHLNNLLDTVQQLQHQKLSIRLLDLQQLNTLHTSLKRSAKQNNWQLLINTPQDIFQLDVSYIRKKSDVIIMVHVPCLTDNNLLTIYRYANLPLPVNTLQLSPKVNESLNTLLPVHTINDLLTQFNSLRRTPIQ